MRSPAVTIVCGHYGCGKTNLTLNLALEAAAAGGPVTLADLDVVNPYFRSCEYRGLLEKSGVRVIAPVFAGTTLDTPTLPPEIYSILSPQAGRVFVDAGGDDAGATALGGLSPRLDQAGYQMLYVVNRFRALTQTPEEAAGLLGEIEAACRLRASAVVNNSHLGVETAWEDIREAASFGRRTAELLGLPLLYSTVPDFAAPEPLPEGFKKVRRYVRFAWEEEAQAAPRYAL